MSGGGRFAPKYSNAQKMLIKVEIGIKKCSALLPIPTNGDRCDTLSDYENVEDFAFIINGTPEVVNFAANPNENLVEIPAARRSWSLQADPFCIG